MANEQKLQEKTFSSEKNVYYKWENISLLLFKSVRRFRYREGFEASLFHQSSLESVLRQVDGFVIKKNTWKIWQNGELPN